MAENHIDIQALLAQLKFPEEGLVDAILTQADLFRQAADYRMQTYRAARAAEMRVASLKVSVAQGLRAKADAESRKLTVQALTELVDSDPTIRAARAERAEALANDEHGRLVVDMFRERSAAADRLVRLRGTAAAMEAGWIRGELEKTGLGATLLRQAEGRFTGGGA